MSDIEEHEIKDDRAVELQPFSLAHRPAPFEKDFRPKAIAEESGPQVVATHHFKNDGPQFEQGSLEDEKATDNPAPDKPKEDAGKTKRSPLLKSE